MASSTQQTRYRVDGMDCASCAAKIDKAVRRVPGVEDVSVSATAGTMTVRHVDDGAIGPAIAEKVTRLGYKLAAIPSRSVKGARVNATKTSCCRQNHDHEGDHQDEDDHGHSHHHGNNGQDSAWQTPGHKHENVHGNEPGPGLHGHDHGPANRPWWKSPKGLLTIASGVALVAAYAIGKSIPQLEPWIFTAAMLIGLLPIAWRAVMAAFAGTPFSIETLMTVAAVGAVIIGASEEAATVVFLFLIGELLEGVAAGKARASIQSLTTLVPKTALLEQDGKTREVAVDDLTVGSVILIRPGDRIPADGVIISGESAIDEAPVTGESTPIRKGVEAIVFAGTVNGDAALRVRVTAAVADNTIARVVKLVEEAQESKAPTERFIDRFSRYYTPGVVVVAALVAVIPPSLFGAVWSSWIYKGLAILLIGCPCALVISTPAAIAAALSAGARRGLLLKGGAVLENLGKITAVAFDKTGTLTEGKPRVTDVMGFGRSEKDVLRLAAALESGSSHPLAKAILDRAASDNIAVPLVMDGRAIGGKGITGTVEGTEAFLGSPQAASDRTPLTSAQMAQIAAFNHNGKTVSVLLAAGQPAGAIAMRDEPRPDARAGLKALSDAGINTLMLTGDTRRTAEAIGKHLGIEVRAELLPEDKQRIVGELKNRGFSVAKIGDGINDAPALAAADVGIAMGGGTDVALETADAAILHGRVGDVAAMVALSKTAMANIRQNITIALGLKTVFLVTTILGITGLWPAILADTGATVLVTMNALRLLKSDPPGTG